MDMVPNMDFEQMKNVDVKTVDRESLVDISGIHINSQMSREQRLADFVSQIGNPYCYRCGKVVVKVSFADTSATLEDRLEHYLKTL